MSENKSKSKLFEPTFAPRLIVPESFDLCFTYEEQVQYLAYHLNELQKKVEELETKVLTPGT